LRPPYSSTAACAAIWCRDNDSACPIDRRADEHYQVGSPAIQVAAGIRARLLHTIDQMGEYKFTRTREQVDIFSGKIRELLASHHLVTGPVIHF
jgi:hypothetical protein